VAAFGKKPKKGGHCCAQFKQYQCSVESKLKRDNPGGGKPLKVAIL